MPGSGGAPSIICLGTTPALQRTMIFDRLEVGGVNRASQVAEYASGKPINVARVLRALGREPIFIGPAGGDRGQRLRADLAASGIVADVVESTSPTRLCVTAIDGARRLATELVEEAGPLKTGETAATLRLLSRRLAGKVVGMVVMSGSLAPVAPVNSSEEAPVPAGDDFYGRAVRLAREAGVRAMVDARDRPLLAALDERPDVVKLNAEELASTLGRKLDGESGICAAMREVIERGAGAIVVTRGSEGALATDGRRTIAVDSPRVQSLSAIGSGDAFAAGLAAALVDVAGLEEACRLGAACGAANAETARAGQVEPGRVAALLEQVSVRDVG